MATNVGTQLASFVIQIILARILDPSAYGTVALVTFFVSVANVFVTTGYASALIQRKDISEVECSTSFFIGIAVALTLYATLFLMAPFVASFYSVDILISILRIQSLTLIFGALTSVHNAIIIRTLQFRKFFYINLSGITAQGVVGIVMALRGFGIWALVTSYVANRIVTLIVTWLVVKWHPQFIFSFKAFKDLFSFSSKVLIFTLIDTVYSNIRSLIIGKKYSEEMLAYYNRGNQIPTLVATDGIGSISNVLFPALSRYAENGVAFKSAYRSSYKLMFYISFPIYLGLAAVSEPLTIVLLTEKWRDSIIFMQIVSITLIFNPFFTRTHVYNAMGRSDISMWLSIVDKVLITFLLIFAVIYGDVYTLVISAFVSNAMAMLVGFFVNCKVLNYRYREQLKDALPPFILAICMFVPVYMINFLNIENILKLFIQTVSGVAIYALGSKLIKMESFVYLWGLINSYFKSKNH